MRLLLRERIIFLGWHCQPGSPQNCCWKITCSRREPSCWPEYLHQCQLLLILMMKVRVARERRPKKSPTTELDQSISEISWTSQRQVQPRDLSILCRYHQLHPHHQPHLGQQFPVGPIFPVQHPSVSSGQVKDRFRLTSHYNLPVAQPAPPGGEREGRR